MSIIYNNASSRKQVHPLLSYHIKIHSHICLELFLLTKVCLYCTYVCPLSLEETILWIGDSYFGQKQQFEVKNALIMDFFTNSFWLLKTLIDGLEWCGLPVDYCDVFISCSDGTHSLQIIHWWASDGMLHFSKSVPMKKQTHLHLGWSEGWVHFQHFFFFGKLNCDLTSSHLA